MKKDIITVDARVAGVSYRRKWVARLEEDTEIYLEREPNNPHDPNAVAVYAVFPHHGDHQIGYIPREVAPIVADYLDAGYSADVTIAALYGGYGDKPNRGVRLSIVLRSPDLPAPRRKNRPSSTKSSDANPPSAPPPKPQSPPPKDPAPSVSPAESVPAPEPSPPTSNEPNFWLALYLYPLAAGATIVAVTASPITALTALLFPPVIALILSHSPLPAIAEAWPLYAGVFLFFGFLDIPLMTSMGTPWQNPATALAAAGLAYTAFTFALLKS